MIWKDPLHEHYSVRKSKNIKAPVSDTPNIHLFLEDPTTPIIVVKSLSNIAEWK